MFYVAPTSYRFSGFVIRVSSSRSHSVDYHRYERKWRHEVELLLGLSSYRLYIYFFCTLFMCLFLCLLIYLSSFVGFGLFCRHRSSKIYTDLCDFMDTWFGNLDNYISSLLYVFFSVVEKEKKSKQKAKNKEVFKRLCKLTCFFAFSFFINTKGSHCRLFICIQDYKLNTGEIPRYCCVWWSVIDTSGKLKYELFTKISPLHLFVFSSSVRYPRIPLLCIFREE